MAIIKYKDADGNWQNINVKVMDTLPLGSVVEYDGASVPSGWENIGNNKIKKIEESIQTDKIANAHYEGQDKTYSCEYINKLSDYSTEEQRIGKWVDGKNIYRKVIIVSSISSGSNLINIPNDIAEITDFNVISRRYDNNITNIIKNNQTIQAGYRQLVSLDLTNNKVEIYIEGIHIQYSHITLEYTKTTD